MVGIILYAIALVLVTAIVFWSLRLAPKKSPAAEQPLFRKLAVILAAVLVVQFFAGLLVNLWITLPKSHPGAKATSYFTGVYAGVKWALTSSGIAILVIHVFVALLLIALSVLFLGAAIRKLNRFWIKTFAWTGFFIMGAFFNGASFLNYGEAISSLLMELFFASALWAILIALYRTKPPTKS